MTQDGGPQSRSRRRAAARRACPGASAGPVLPPGFPGFCPERREKKHLSLAPTTLPQRPWAASTVGSVSPRCVVQQACQVETCLPSPSSSLPGPMATVRSPALPPFPSL